MATQSSTTELLRTLLRSAMHREADLPLEPAPPAPPFPSDLADEIARHRVAETMLRHADGVAIDNDLRTALHAQRDVSTVATLRVLRAIRGVTAALTAADIPHLFFKGVALAQQTAGDPFARGFGDIDLLVPPRLLREALDVLEAAEWTRSTQIPPDPNSWAARYHLRTSYELSLHANGVDLDLHWRLDPAHHAFPPFDDLWAERAEVEVAGVALPTLAPLTALRHSSSHAAKDEANTLRALVDVHRLSRHRDLPAGWHEALRPIDRRVLAIAADSLGVEALPAEARLIVTSVRRRHLTRARTSQEKAPHRTDLSRLRPEWIRSARTLSQSSRHPGDWAAAFSGAVLQTRDFVEVTDRHAATAIPKAIVARARRLSGRFSQRRKLRGG